MESEFFCTALPSFSDNELLNEEILSFGNIIKLKNNQKAAPEIHKEATGIYYIQKGAIRSLRISPAGNQKIIAVIPKGYFIFDTCFFSKLPVRLEHHAIGDTTLALFPSDIIYTLCQENRHFLQCVFRSLTYKAYWMGSEVAATSMISHRSRLKICLSGLASEPDKEGIRTVAYNQYELSEIVGLHRITVNRLLKGLREQNLITTSRGKILLLPKFFLDTDLQ